MIRYQIRDWNVHFENDRSRNRRQCSFVCVPNKQHGLGFSRIMAEPDGAAIYGIWHCIVGACSQQKERDGWLTVNGDMAGSPWGADDLALKFRRPVEEVVRALEFLSSLKVDWVIEHGIKDLEEETPVSNRAVTVQSPPAHLEGKRREVNGREGKEENLHDFSQVELKEPPKSKGSIEEVRKFCRGLELPETDADWFFHKCEGNGWKNGGSKIKDWRATIRAWKTAGYMPSQKANQQNGHHTPLNLKTIIQSKEILAGQLKLRYAAEGALDTTWSDQSKREEWKKLRREITELNKQISQLA